MSTTHAAPAIPTPAPAPDVEAVTAAPVITPAPAPVADVPEPLSTTVDPDDPDRETYVIADEHYERTLAKIKRAGGVVLVSAPVSRGFAVTVQW